MRARRTGTLRIHRIVNHRMPVVQSSDVWRWWRIGGVGGRGSKREFSAFISTRVMKHILQGARCRNHHTWVTTLAF